MSCNPLGDFPHPFRIEDADGRFLAEVDGYDAARYAGRILWADGEALPLRIFNQYGREVATVETSDDPVRGKLDAAAIIRGSTLDPNLP